MADGIIDKIEEIGADEHELSHVPEGKKNKGLLQMIAVWGGVTFVPVALVVGASMASQLTVVDFLIAWTIGLFLAAVVGILLGVISMEQGLSFHTASRVFYGRIGTFVPSGALTITRIGWSAVELALVASFVVTILGDGIPYLFQIGALVLGLLYISTALLGLDALKIISYVAIPVVTVVFLFGAFNLGITVTNPVVEDPIPITAGISAAIAFWIAGATTSGDWLRYSDSKSTVAGSTVVAVVFFSLFLLALGYFNVLATGETSLSSAMAAQGLAIPAFIALALLAWSTVDNNLYSASLGLSNMIELRKVASVLLIGAVVIVMGGLKFHTMVIPYLQLIGAFIPPLAAPFIVEYFMLGTHRNELQYIDLDDIDYSVNWLAIIAWAIGSAVAYNLPQRLIPALSGIIVASIAYGALYFVLKDTALYAINDSTAVEGAGAVAATQD